MSSGNLGERDAIPEIRRQPEMTLLFDVTADRFNKVAAAQPRNLDARFYTIESFGRMSFYVFKLTNSYEQVSSVRSEDTDIVDILIPALGIDHEEPIIERLTDNPDAFFLARRHGSQGEAMIIVKTDRIDRILEGDLSSDPESSFFGDIPPEERIMTLANIIGAYHLIPSSVIRTPELTDRFFLSK